MKNLLLLSSATLAAHLAAQGPSRSPDHPLPPTVSVATTSQAPTTTARQALPTMPAAVPTTGDQAPRPRGNTRAPAAARDLPAAVLFDRPTGGELWALGHDWKASFDGRGLTFVPFFGSEAPRNFPLRIELASVTVAGSALQLALGAPELDGATVRTARGPLVEVVETGIDEIEQSFVFDSLPQRGAIEVDISLRSELAVSSTDDGLRFTNELGNIDYKKAIAVDATGRSLPLPIVWDGDSAHITIPAEFVAEATLPLVLDPIVNSNLAIAPGQVQLQREPDVATLQAPDRSLVVWQRQWSVTDQDCFAEVLNESLGYVAPAPITIDFTGLNWVGPRVASNANARNFLIVAQIDDQFGNVWIGGRTVDDLGGTGGFIDIERGGVVGLAGNNFRPDVGGDPFPGTPAYYNVVWEHETAAGNHDIYYKLVLANGTLLTSNPTVLANLAENESLPSISKCNWEADWHIAYQRQWPFAPFDQDIWEARISWFGSIAVAPQVIAGSALEEQRPSVSSLALPTGFVTGANAMVAYELYSGGQSNIRCAVIAYAGGVATSFDLSATEAFGVYASRNQIFPECDSDGVRFVVGYSEYNGSDYDTYVGTIAYEPVANTLRIDEERVLLGGTIGVDDYWTRMSAYHNGAGQPNPRYIVTGAAIATNDIPVWEYGGYQAGQFFSYFGTQCGSLTITPSGTPAIGQTINFVVNTPLPSGTVFGTPGLIPLISLGCNCFLGVNNGIVAGNPLPVTIPSDPTLVGSLWSVQGYGFSGANCLGFLDLSDTVDFTVR